MKENHLVIRDPWTMPYFEYEQQFIDELKREIGPDHPLYRKRLYVTAVRRDPTAVIFETVAEKSIYALVYLTYSGKRGKRNFLMSYDNTSEVARLAKEHGFERRPIAMKNPHHAKMTELLIGRDLSWLKE